VIDAAAAPRYFNGKPQNIGIVLGPTSKGLTDVDLDCAEAVALAPYLLPRTEARFGRRSKPDSHYLYETALAETAGKATLTFKAPKTGEMLVELRVGGPAGNGAQTVFPGSVHESGEPVEWAKAGKPAAYDGGRLRLAVAALAAAVLILRGWPPAGAKSRHDAARVVGGFLARCGWSPDEAAHLIGAVAKVAGQDDVKDRQRAAQDAVAAYRAGKHAHGMPAMIGTFGEPAAKQIAEWLGFKQKEEPPADETPPVILRPTLYVPTDPRTIPPRAWIYSRHFIRKFISATIAPGAVGKSSLEIAEALAIVTGRDLLGIQPDERTNVWLWNGEDPYEELQRRIEAAILHYQIAPKEIAGRLFVDTGRQMKICIAEQTKSGTVIQRPVVSAIKAALRENNIGLLSIDPFVASHRVTENDNNAIELVVAEWTEVADETGCAIDLVHHSRKTGGAEVTVEDGRGAVALLAKARSARVLNTMSEDEAAKAGVENRRVHFRVSNGKANLALVQARLCRPLQRPCRADGR
jgi:hypothetical protein